MPTIEEVRTRYSYGRLVEIERILAVLSEASNPRMLVWFSGRFQLRTLNAKTPINPKFVIGVYEPFVNPEWVRDDIREFLQE